MPLADHAGGVPGLLQDRRQCRPPCFDDERGVAGQNPGPLLAKGIFAGHQRVTRRRACRRGRVPIGKAQSLARQPIDVRRLHCRRTIRRDVAVTEIVHVDEDDVRTRLGKRDRRKHRQQDQKEQLLHGSHSSDNSPFKSFSPQRTQSPQRKTFKELCVLGALRGEDLWQRTSMRSTERCRRYRRFISASEKSMNDCQS